MATKSDDKNKAGKDASVTQQTTAQAEEERENLPTEAVKREESDPEAAAEGSTVGAVVDGDTGFDYPDSPVDHDDDYDEDEDVVEFTAVDDDGVEGALGVVTERNLHGEEYDVPWLYITADHVERPRTSDSDDPAVSWTAQEAAEKREDEDGNEQDTVALVPVQATPGQTFRVRELPNREVAEKAGIDYDQWIAGLPIRADVPDEGPRQGVPA